MAITGFPTPTKNLVSSVLQSSLQFLQRVTLCLFYKEDAEAQKRETSPSRSPVRLLGSIVHALHLLLVQ